MINNLLLLSGMDIPFPEAQMVIHAPTIKEIGLIGEESFFNGCGILNFSKDNLSEQDRVNLANISEIEILMMIMNNNQIEAQKNKVNALMVLSLLFPDYQISFSQKAIHFQHFENEEEKHVIDDVNFLAFKKILEEMFCLKGRGDDIDNPEYNPGGRLAKDIAEKFAKRRQVIAEQQGPQKINILERYASILSVGLKIDLNTVLNYTVFQLYDQYERFELQEQFDLYIKSRLAGAKGDEEIENWKKDIHI
jgi:hypothetical protein